ncbi:MAG: hypothetical protein LBR80_12250 [Deltaproteobacteria bacterium]|nr:hypothetical protein [Deltaproteobacteria bacterium]
MSPDALMAATDTIKAPASVALKAPVAVATTPSVVALKVPVAVAFKPAAIALGAFAAGLVARARSATESRKLGSAGPGGRPRASCMR